MIYNLDDDFCRKQIEARLQVLLKKRCLAELSEKTPRTNKQNRYLHVCLGVIAMETGNTLEYVKREYFKLLVNRSIFQIEKSDPYVGIVTDTRSSKDLTKEEMATAIDRFRKWAADEGFYLPSPDDESLIASVEYQMGRMRQYL